MKNVILSIKLSTILVIAAAVASLSSCTQNNNNDLSRQGEIDSLRGQIAEMVKGNEMISKNIATFDTLDYTVFSNQQWTRLHESHSKDIKVSWPDGHNTVGIEKHIEDLKAMFVYAPNTSIKDHPIRFGSGNMTCVTGIINGTFTDPMPIGKGKFIQPTGNSFSIPMCTVGIWKDGVMIEEYLFWDNQTYMEQLGIDDTNN